MQHEFKDGDLVCVKESYPLKLSPHAHELNLRGKKGKIRWVEKHSNPLVVFPVRSPYLHHGGGILEKPRGWFIPTEHLELVP
jgi:hypothetical protein